MKNVEIFDTSFRDGVQADSKRPSLDDAVKILEDMDSFGFDFAELGFIGDKYAEELFVQFKKKNLAKLKLTIFGRTRKANEEVAKSSDAKKMVDLGVKTATIVAKSRLLDVENCLLTDAKNNLAMIDDTLRYLKKNKVKVIFDLEHAIDAFYGREAYGKKMSDKEARANRKHFLDIINTAAKAKADVIVLCDTNGKANPEETMAMTKYLTRKFPEVKFGMHAHNDRNLAVANSRAAVLAGARHIQGTIDGSGERCGNLAFSTFIPDLQINDGFKLVDSKALKKMSNFADRFAVAFDRRLNDHAPYVGKYAFSTRAGMHISGEKRHVGCYTFLDPGLVGNQAKIAVDGQSGRSGIALKAQRLGFDLSQAQLAEFIAKFKTQIDNGAFIESDALFKLACRKIQDNYKAPFELIEYQADTKANGLSHAIVQVKIKDKIKEVEARGTGIFDALFKAVQNAILPVYPDIDKVNLVTYDSNALNVTKAGSESLVKVLIRFRAKGRDDWRIVGLSPNSIQAGLDAIVDSFYYFLLK